MSTPDASPAARLGFSRRLHSRSDDIVALTDALADWAESSGIPLRTANYLNLMLDELVANIVMHAYAGRDDGLIEIAAQYTETEDAALVCVTLRDYGPAFDPTQLPPPDTAQDIEERQFGGLGVHFVRKLADHFSYRRDGEANEIVFCKQATPANGNADD